jgi:prefoldin subunit 5
MATETVKSLTTRRDELKAELADATSHVEALAAELLKVRQELARKANEK